MKPNSSSTSSSEATLAGTEGGVETLEVERKAPESGFRLKRARRTVVPVLLSTLLWLVVLDVGIARLTRPDPNPKVEPKGAARYFEYGRSVESKLRHMVHATPETTAPVALAGWMASPEGVRPPEHFEPTRPSDSKHVLVAVYGQSFSLRATVHLPEVDHALETRFLGGPAAPLSHSFALYEADRGKQEAQVVTLGVLASSLARLTSLTNMTLWFEDPQPSSYPRYVLSDGQLSAIEPVVRSYDDLRDAVSDPLRWQRFVDQLSQHDAAYDPFIFEHDILDYSTIGRALRRAIGQRHVRAFGDRYMDAHGFTNHDQILDIAEAIFAKFAEDARKDGKLPYVLLFNDSGYGTFLVDALGPRLTRHNVPFFSSDSVIPPNDPANYEADGHFRADLDFAFARAWAADLRQRLTPPTGEAHASLHNATAENTHNN